MNTVFEIQSLDGENVPLNCGLSVLTKCCHQPHASASLTFIRIDLSESICVVNNSLLNHYCQTAADIILEIDSDKAILMNINEADALGSNVKF